MPVVTHTVARGGTLLPATASSVSGSVSAPSLSYPMTTARVASTCVPLLGAPLDVLATLTDAGRNLIARAQLEGLAYRVIGFRVGRGGYDPSNPLAPTAIDPADTELQDPVYPSVTLDPATIARYEYPNTNSVSFLCRVPSSSAIAGLGEIAVYADITSSPLDPTEVGDRYMFAVAHRPLVGKTLQDVLVWRMIVQY